MDREIQPGWIYLNHATLKEAGVSAAQAEEKLVDWLRQQPGIQTAYGRTRLEKGGFGEDKIGESVRRSYYRPWSGDVAIVLKPYYLISGPVTESRYDSYRTTHGTPHPYDTHVPLVVFGTGVRAGIHEERVTPLAIAAIAARASAYRRQRERNIRCRRGYSSSPFGAIWDL